MTSTTFSPGFFLRYRRGSTYIAEPFGSSVGAIGRALAIIESSDSCSDFVIYDGVGTIIKTEAELKVMAHKR